MAIRGRVTGVVGAYVGDARGVGYSQVMKEKLSFPNLHALGKMFPKLLTKWLCIQWLISHILDNTYHSQMY